LSQGGQGVSMGALAAVRANNQHSGRVLRN